MLDFSSANAECPIRHRSPFNRPRRTRKIDGRQCFSHRTELGRADKLSSSDRIVHVRYQTVAYYTIQQYEDNGIKTGSCSKNVTKSVPFEVCLGKRAKGRSKKEQSRFNPCLWCGTDSYDNGWIYWPMTKRNNNLRICFSVKTRNGFGRNQLDII